MEKFASIDSYIAACDPAVQTLLRQVRDCIRAAAPAAMEKISYGMPTYFLRKNLVHFAAAKAHLGFYPTPEAIVFFAERLAPYKTSKGAVQFPYAQPIPFDLIAEITAFRVKSVQELL